MQKHFFVLLGTRPEAIKLFPVINRLKAERNIAITVCATAQHRQLLDQVLKLANVVPDFDLNLMTTNQTLDNLTARLLGNIGEVLDRVRPTRVIVQGDTATAMAGALASYYHRIPVSHVEAGLRSGDIYAPWPEEVNRKIVGSIADQHFAPTERAAQALRSENVSTERIHVTGNTVVDALILAKAMVEADPDLSSRWDGIKKHHGNRRIILVTCHRRENFGGGILNIVNALQTILKREDVAVVLPVHPNPNVHDVFAAEFSNHPRVVLISPQEYTDFVSLLSLCHLVLTDSGGVQEEAPTFGKPVLVMRETTERPEGIEAGTARLVGANYDRIVEETFRLLDDDETYASMSRSHNPFGDGHASERIVRALLMHEFQKVAVIGLGYIGLPTAALIASRGMQVLGVDNKEDVVRTVASGAIHISEPDLDGLVSKVVSGGALTTSTKPEPADVFIIAVPTPIDCENRPDLSSVNTALESILDLLAPGNLVILESTSPIGTTEGISRRISERRPDLHIGTNGTENGAIYVAYCPERVLPGRILTELVNNDRCIGGVTPACTRRAQRFYKSFVRGACVATTARAAELVKLTENAFRDTNIAFANELSLICDRFDINVWEVIDIANRHPRVNVLRPGPGVGGHCIAVDPWFIIDSAPELAHVMRTSREVNLSKTQKVIERACALIEDHPYANVACCGLTFKANIDDLRESPAMEIALHLAAKYGARIKIVEPNLRRLPPELADHHAGFMNIDEALRSCEIAILLVDHDEFKMVPLAERRHLDVIDTRGIWQDMPART